MTTSRRGFVAAALATPILTAEALAQKEKEKEKPPASRRITLGFIGTGNQGLNDIRGFLGDRRVQVVAVCDVNRESTGYWNGGTAGRDPAKRLVENHYAAEAKAGTYKGCDTYEDFRDL